MPPSDLDPQRKANGIPFDKIKSVLAIPACESAVRRYPNSVRLIYQLGRAYAKANDFGPAVMQYQKAADRGYVPSEYDLGALYEKGLCVAQDEAQAVAWYRRAAEQGFALAQSNLGNRYRNGQGVPQDYAEALKWLQEAADQGNANALVTLGTMYAAGQGVRQDYSEAVKFYRTAAQQGDAYGQTNLASMYARVSRKTTPKPRSGLGLRRLAPDVLERLRRHGRVFYGVRDRGAPEKVLQASCVHSPRRLCVSRRMAQHVDVNRQRKLGGFPSPLDHAADAHAREWVTALVDEHIGPPNAHGLLVGTVAA
jgi:hypothetical protein